MTTTSKRRTDAHAPSNFVPENYEYVGSYDASPSAYMVVTVGQWGEKQVSYTSEKAHADRMMAMVAASTESRNDGRCDHCGANIRYRAVMRHRPTGQVVQCGEQCLENRFSVATADFRAMKRAAEEARKMMRVRKAVAAWMDAHPDMAWMASQEGVDANVAADNWFVRDVCRRFQTYGEVSDRQVAAVQRSLVQDAEFKARKAERDAQRAAEEAARPHADCPEGRVTVTGAVVSVREPDQYAQFPAWKMLVADDRGFRVWGTVPSALFGRYGSAPRRGDRVTFTAQVQRSDKDADFGFYSRPTQARVVAEAPVEGSGK